jgi:hypothetical protein
MPCRQARSLLIMRPQSLTLTALASEPLPRVASQSNDYGNSIHLTCPYQCSESSAGCGLPMLQVDRSSLCFPVLLEILSLWLPRK